MRGPEVGDRGGHDQHVGVGGVLGHRVAQLLRRADVHDVDAGRVGQPGGVPGDQRDLGAALGGDPGHRVALLARAAVADEPHRVDRLAGAAGGHQHLAAGQVVGQRVVRGPAAAGRSVVISSGSGSRPAPLSAPVSRPDAGSSTTAPRRRSVATLSTVAGCCHISVCIAGANSTGHRAVSSVAVSRSSARPCDGPGQQVGGGRRDDDQVGLLADAGRAAPRDVLEHAGVDRLAGQRLEGGGADEAQRGLGGDDADVVAGLGELANDGARLVGGDATGDADDDPLAVHPLFTPRGSSQARLVPLLAFGVLEQVGVDLAQRDRQRLLLQARLDQRADVLEDALAELVVVVVDLPGPLGRVDHQRVLARHAVEQLVDGRVGDAQRRVVGA